MVTAAAGAVLAASGAALAQTDALFFPIEGTPESEVPGTLTEAWSVSPDGGVVVGRMFGELTPGSGMVEGAFFRWTPSGGVEILRLPDGSTSEQDIRGASHDGSRIFGVEYNPDPRATLSGWYWTESPTGSGMGPVVSIPADPYFGSELHCSSADGSVMFGYYNAGTFEVQSPHRREALRWSETGGYETLPFLDPSHDEAWVFDCSDDGNIAVGLSNDRAVLWNVSGGTVTDMNVGALGGMATAVSANGQHAAGARTTQDPIFHTFLSRGFKWDAGGGVTDLDPQGFSNLVVPTAISDDGQTVVGAQSSTFYDAPSGPGFIWTGSNGFQFFDDYVLFDINVTNQSMSGWSFGVIRDMSGDGRIFVGSAISPEDKAVGFVLYVGVEPPAPPACVCETDGAEGVNVFDLLSYLDGWFAGDAAADLDGQAGVDVFDLLFFLDCWFPASAGEPC
jgi:uncharacterized membrane protein